jgi:hypothetical protein
MPAFFIYKKGILLKIGIEENNGETIHSGLVTLEAIARKFGFEIRFVIFPV